MRARGVSDGCIKTALDCDTDSFMQTEENLSVAEIFFYLHVLLFMLTIRTLQDFSINKAR